MEKKKGYGLQIAYDVLLSMGFPLCALYVIFLVFHQELIGEKWIWGMFLALVGVYWLTVFCLGLANIIQSFRKHRKGDAVFCVNAMLVLKYGLIVFFILNFVVIFLGFLIVELAAVVASRGTIIFAFPVWITATLAAVGFYIFYTWLVMLPGSFYGIQVIRFSRREGKISGGMSVVHGLLQFMFLADVLDSLYLAVRKWNMGKRSSWVVGGLYALAIFAAAAGVLFLVFRYKSAAM